MMKCVTTHTFSFIEPCCICRLFFSGGGHNFKVGGCRVWTWYKRCLETVDRIQEVIEGCGHDTGGGLRLWTLYRRWLEAASMIQEVVRGGRHDTGDDWRLWSVECSSHGWIWKHVWDMLLTPMSVRRHIFHGQPPSVTGIYRQLKNGLKFTGCP